MGLDRIMKLSLLAALIVYGVVYWSIQPTCGPGEVRVRGVFMTACLIGH